MPTRLHRHAVTETPDVKSALDLLRKEMSGERVDMRELVVLGAEAKLALIRASRRDVTARRQRLAEMVRASRSVGDGRAAEEARRSGWIPHT